MFCEAIIIAGLCVSPQVDYVNIQEHQTMADVATSYDGVERDISRFYKPENPSVRIGTSIYIDDDKKLSLQYDNGYESSKYELEDSLSVQYTQIFDLKENHSLTISGGATIGGKSNHTSCIDSFGREYYCGDLTAWNDFKTTDYDTPWNASLVYSMRF